MFMSVSAKHGCGCYALFPANTTTILQNSGLKGSAVHNYYIKRELRQESSVVINHSETMSV